MSKMRIYEYARQNNTTSKEVIQQLKKFRCGCQNHMSTISIDTIVELDKNSHQTGTELKVNPGTIISKSAVRTTIKIKMKADSV